MASIRRRKNGLYEARLQRDGRRFSIYGRTETEARQKLAELERKLAIDQPPPPGKLTVQELCERWLETERKRWKPRTLHDYQRLLERFVYPAIGSVRLAKLTPDRLQRFFDAIPGRAASQTFRVLHRCLSVSTRWGYLAANPCDRVVPPTYQAPPVELPDADALAKLFRHCLESDDDYAPLIGLTLLTGLRLGEILALRWDDVDIEAGRLSVVRAGQWIHGEWVETAPKTRSGRRVVPIGELGIRLLRRQKAVVAKRKLQAGPAWQEYRLVFPATDGRPLSPDRVSAAMRRLCKAAGVPKLTFHQLRHSSASLSLLAGVALPDLSRRLGHADVSITTRIYAHAIGDGRKVAEAIERVLGG
jgi:integrase